MTTKVKIETGQICMTRGVNKLVTEDIDFSGFVYSSLKRHIFKDWGDLCQEDKQANNQALITGARIFSAYQNQGLPKIWIITEADRSVTTILFPDEY